jgi:hypothetical protein
MLMLRTYGANNMLMTNSWVQLNDTDFGTIWMSHQFLTIPQFKHKLVCHWTILILWKTALWFVIEMCTMHMEPYNTEQHSEDFLLEMKIL